MFHIFVEPITTSLIIAGVTLVANTLIGYVMSDAFATRGEKVSKQLQEEARQDAAEQFRVSMDESAKMSAEQNKLFEKQKFEQRTPYGVGEERFRGGKK